jgi:hypothetical protein
VTEVPEVLLLMTQFCVFPKIAGLLAMPALLLLESLHQLGGLLKGGRDSAHANLTRCGTEVKWGQICHLYYLPRIVLHSQAGAAHLISHDQLYLSSEVA